MPERALDLGVSVVPLFVVFGDRSYRDCIDLSRAEFYELLEHEKMLPITSQPTSQMFEDVFRSHVDAGEEIICITCSSHLSGTINAAKAAAQCFPGASIEIYDSQSAAGGLGLMVMRAAELRTQGANMQEILAALDFERANQRLYACLPDLSHLVRTGRIGKAKAAIGTLMRIVPVIVLKEGRVDSETQVRTFARAVETMLDLSIKAAPDVAKARFLVMHTNALQLAYDVLEKLKARLSGATPRMLDVLEAGPVIGTHGGQGAVGIFIAQDN